MLLFSPQKDSGSHERPTGWYHKKSRCCARMCHLDFILFEEKNMKNTLSTRTHYFVKKAPIFDRFVHPFVECGLIYIYVWSACVSCCNNKWVGRFGNVGYRSAHRVPQGGEGHIKWWYTSRGDGETQPSWNCFWLTSGKQILLWTSARQEAWRSFNFVAAKWRNFQRYLCHGFVP